MQRLLVRLAAIAADPDDSEDLRIEKTLMVGLMIVGVALLLLWSTLYLFLSQRIAATLLLCHAIAVLTGLVLYYRKQISYHATRTFQRALLLIVPFLVTVSLGGIVNSSGFVLWSLIAPIGAAVLGESLGVFLRWSAIPIIWIVVAGLIQLVAPATHALSPGVLTALFVVNLCGVSAVVLLEIYYIAHQRALAFRLLRDEQQKAENLLLNILPKEIATLLKQDAHTIADYYDGASILFADVVGFTRLTDGMTPVEVVNLLNDLFSYFDMLVEKYDVEKIKTIGDCYMVAAGVPRRHPDHACALAGLALQMCEYVREHHFGARQLTLRIGINSGPVAAGVIGRKKFIYDLWGDAVTMASRMESHAPSWAVQITRTTYDLIKDKFICEPRGTVSIKGKGEVQVWHVVGEKP